MPSPYIRKEFLLQKVTSNAFLEVACLGVYQIYLNGHLVNDSYLCQEVDEYRRTVSSHRFEVSSYLQKGKNVLGIVLGDGWYASNLSYVGKNAFGPYPLKVWYRLTNGTEIIESDGKEKWHDGEIRASDNQNGEIIDHRFSLGDFSSPSYLAKGWKQVETFEVPLKEIPSSLPLVCAFQTDKPITTKHNGKRIQFDFGQNCAGVLEVIAKGKKGASLIVRHGEVLNEDGSLYTDNLRTAKATDTFVLSGEKEETFLPRFTFHGFRYAEIEIQGEAEIISVVRKDLSTDLQPAGTLKIATPLLQKIADCVYWGARSNFLAQPTDCPQRDERLGWTGDAEIFFGTSTYLFDVRPFFGHYLQTMRDAIDLQSDGVPVFVPYILPDLLRVGEPGWSDAIIFIPYELYVHYGEKHFLEDNYPYMERFYRYMQRYEVGKNGLLERKTYGDWLSVDETLPCPVYNTAYYAEEVRILAKISHILGKEERAAYYESEYAKTKAIFRQAYYHDGKILGDTQSAYVFAYRFGLLSKEEAKPNLLRKLAQCGHLTTGFHATKFLLPVLSEWGKEDIAYSLLLRKEYPSWGYMIDCGATTLWERWDSYRKDKGFNDVGMNSFNHYAFGTCLEWMYETMLGIAPEEDEPGFTAVHIAPRFDPRVPELSGYYDSPKGRIEVSYRVQDDGIHYELHLPEGVKPHFDFVTGILSSQRQKRVYTYVFTKEKCKTN